MLDYILMKSIVPMGQMTPAQQKRARMASLVAVLVYAAIWVWALFRAVNCGKRQMKVVHVFFAAVCPIVYLAFSYFSDDFCTCSCLPFDIKKNGM